MRKSKERRREEVTGTLWISAMLNILRGGALAAGVSILVLAAAAAMISAGMLRDELADSMVIAACMAGGFVGGLIVIKCGSTASLVAGAGVGLTLFLLLLTAGVMVYDAQPEAREAGTILCACMCGGGLAGVLGKKPQKRRRG